MRPLTTTLPPAEVAKLLDIPPALVDALLDSGRILCQVKDGQALIPLAQLEEFFRDGLIRVYQGEGSGPQLPVASGQLPGELRPSQVVPGTGNGEREGSGPQLPVASGQLPGALRASEEVPRTGNGERATLSGEDALATRNSPPATSPQPATLPDQRRLPRYVPRRQIGGIFDDVKFTIVQISASGLRIRHGEPLLPGSEAKLTFALMSPARSIVVRARVVWTSLASAGEDRFSISGLRVIEHAERLERAVDSLLATHELQPERRERQRRSDDALGVLAVATDDEIALVTSAIQKFASDPVEASRWYSRGRFALSDETVRRVAPRKPRDREEVLGIWEYLDRQVDLEKVASVVAWELSRVRS